MDTNFKISVSVLVVVYTPMLRVLLLGLQAPERTDVQLAPREHLEHPWLDIKEALVLCSSSTNGAAIAALAVRHHAGAPRASGS